MPSDNARDARPWYRHPIPWLLLSGPIAAVIAGFMTLALAIEQPHAMVVDDYSKIGLTTEHNEARDAAARALHVAGTLHIANDSGTITVTLHGARPATLALRLIHPTLARYDQKVTLTRDASGRYDGHLVKPLNGRRYVQLLPPDGRWRLTGEWRGQARTPLAPHQAPS
ncbi:MAG: FixH family protein [Gammaproteobacteria bacterium]|jgi:hypothetical protein